MVYANMHTFPSSTRLTMHEQNPSKMKRRIRKKLYLEEFAVIGFEFSCAIEEMDEDKVDAFFDGLLGLMEEHDLMFNGGGTQQNFGGYISVNTRYGHATEAHRELLKNWLSQQAGVTDIQIDELSDAFYGI